MLLNLDFIDGLNNSGTRWSVIIIMILYLLTSFSSIFESKKEAIYPPFGMSCPDYWTARKATINNQEGYLCTAEITNKNLATNIVNNDYVYYYPSNSKMSIFSRGTPQKNINYKKQWANESGIAWDGSEV